jgi:hypothetical protein
MVSDSASVGNSPDLRLVDHAARLRIVRGARQLDQLFRVMQQELQAAFGIIGSRSQVLGEQVLGDIQEKIDALSRTACILIDDSPLMNGASTDAGGQR